MNTFTRAAGRAVEVILEGLDLGGSVPTMYQHHGEHRGATSLTVIRTPVVASGMCLYQVWPRPSVLGS